MSSDKPIILIVDDVPTNVQVLAEALSLDYQLKVASNGAEALDIAERDQPDLILLDIMMPGMDGFEVCRCLKANSHTQKIAVIFVTAKNTHSDEEMGLKLGAVDYVTKPFVIPVVKARIYNHIRLKKQADLLESLALIDALTHVSNRRRFDEVLASQWRMAMREQQQLSLILIEIDRFKSFNEFHGFGAGDVCLQMVAAEISKTNNRPDDLIARYSGMEFVVLMPKTSLDTALMVAERIRQRIEKSLLPSGSGDGDVSVTVSLGVACQTIFQEYYLSKMLIDAADKALKMAKQGGGNRVFSY
ncbi:MAG: diguanylate cyclase [Methylovulum sp.]|jgi:diguanylate cyclase (GGDEF)-like protein|nr:diguanylate cyclase [Methylovulum sp.]MCF7997538.1 diguanylate cyclase [Methylovulum sp.]